MQVSLNLNLAESVLQAVLKVRSNTNFLKEIAKTITAPDIHGDPLKGFLFVLFTFGFTPITDNEEEEFKQKYNALVDARKAKNGDNFYQALNQFSENIKVENIDYFLRFIGDTLCDRAEGGDHLMLALYRWLNEKKVKGEELFSNHSAGTLALYHYLKNKDIKAQKEIIQELLSLETKEYKKEKDPTKKINIYFEHIRNKKNLGVLEGMKTLAGNIIVGPPPVQAQSFFDFIKKAKDNEDVINTFMTDMKNNYIPYLKLISYQHVGNQFNLYSHTIIGVLTVLRTAHAFKVETKLTEKLFDSGKNELKSNQMLTVDELKKLIDEINVKFAKFAKKEENPNEEQVKHIRRITWARGITTKEVNSNQQFAKKNQLGKFNNVFGHLGSNGLCHLSENYGELNTDKWRRSSKNINILNNNNVHYYNTDEYNELGRPNPKSQLQQSTTIHITFNETENQQREDKFNKESIQFVSLSPRPSCAFFQAAKTTASWLTGAAGIGLILTGASALSGKTLMFTAISAFLLSIPHITATVLIGAGIILLLAVAAQALSEHIEDSDSPSPSLVLH